jgi:phage terminase large subunit GpA-like protein
MRERNEALDTRIYARAAASQFGMDRFQQQHWAALENQMEIRAIATPPSSQAPSPAPPSTAQEPGHNARPIDPFNRLDDRPRWFGNHKRWFDRWWRRAQLLPVNVSALKSELYGWLKLDMPTTESDEPFPPGFCHFPQLGEEFFRQLTAEQLITRLVKGYRQPEWQKMRERNEALDTRIYARAAASQFGIDRFQEQHWAALEHQMEIRAMATPPPCQAPSPVPPSSAREPDRDARAIDPFHRLEDRPRWFGNRKGWFDRWR